jgi:hypothetical protein
MKRSVSLVGLMLVISIALFISPQWAKSETINSLNTSSSIIGGTYLNTPGSRTIFTTPRGIEILPSGTIPCPTTSVPSVPSNGSVHITNPNGVVRLTGNIDVSAIKNSAAYTGNYGHIFVNANTNFAGSNTIYAMNGKAFRTIDPNVIHVEGKMVNFKDSLPANSLQIQGGVLRLVNSERPF